MLLVLFGTHEALQHIDGQREDNGGVFLRSDSGQCLKVPELKGRRRLGDNDGSFFQGSGCIHFPLSCNHLQRGRRGELANSMVPPSSHCVWFICLRQHTGLPGNPSTLRHSVPDVLSLETDLLKMCLAQGIVFYCCLSPIEQGITVVLNRALNSSQQRGE